MDIYAIVRLRIKTIRFFYDTAAEPFLENIRRIDADEEPFQTPPNYDSEEPAFLAEWEENIDGLTLLGHSGITMLQVTLRLFLDSLKVEVKEHVGKRAWKSKGRKKKRESWFQRYKREWLEVLGIDWAEFGESELGVLEQIALARDDILHRPDLWGVDTYQSDEHFAQYKESFFARDRYLEHYKKTGEVLFGKWAIDVTPEKMHQAMELVDRFCKFLDDQWLEILKELREPAPHPFSREIAGQNAGYAQGP